MPSKKKKKAKVHDEMEGLDVYVDEFGEVHINKSQEEINRFLDEHVDDKKLKNKEEKDA